MREVCRCELQSRPYSRDRLVLGQPASRSRQRPRPPDRSPSPRRSQCRAADGPIRRLSPGPAPDPYAHRRGPRSPDRLDARDLRGGPPPRASVARGQMRGRAVRFPSMPPPSAASREEIRAVRTSEDTGGDSTRSRTLLGRGARCAGGQRREIVCKDVVEEPGAAGPQGLDRLAACHAQFRRSRPRRSRPVEAHSAVRQHAMALTNEVRRHATDGVERREVRRICSSKMGWYRLSKWPGRVRDP